MALVPELDVRASAGGGASDPTELSDGQAPLVANWQLPVEFLRQFARGPLPGLAIITVIGSSMQPVIQPGTKVLVDTQDRNPSPPGLFVTYDGFGIVVKHVQPIPFSEPRRVKISSANPLVDPYERVEDEAYIQGRVIGFWAAT
jgi:phage repressor protein C with HTH and peptisase S24 domain